MLSRETASSHNVSGAAHHLPPAACCGRCTGNRPVFSNRRLAPPNFQTKSLVVNVYVIIFSYASRWSAELPTYLPSHLHPSGPPQVFDHFVRKTYFSHTCSWCSQCAFGVLGLTLMVDFLGWISKQTSMTSKHRRKERFARLPNSVLDDSYSVLATFANLPGSCQGAAS